MTSGNEQFDELENLLLEWEDGTLDAAGVSRLRDLLRSHEELRSHYVRLQMINAALKSDGAAGIGEFGTSNACVHAASASPSDRWQKQGTTAWRPRRWMLIVAAVIICVQAGRLLQLEFAGPDNGTQDITEAGRRNGRKEVTAQGVAIVTNLVEVAWGRDQAPLELGDALAPGQLSLASGYAQVEFFCGATVIIEGPAELDLRSPMLAKVRSGRLRAQVPPAARGFSIEVDDMKVVDLGTEFGLSVSAEGANIQVFDGEVELQQPATEKRLLTAGKALTRNESGQYLETDVTPERFLDIAELESRVAGQRNQSFERWQNWSRELRRDDRLIAYYAFDQEGGWNRRLNSSLLLQNSELDGAIVGANRVPGRWSDKSALEFKRPGDRVRVQIPGEFSSLTFACWVKIDSLDRWYNSLFLTDHYNQGEPHWQILDTGQLFFSVRYKPDDVRGPAAKKQTHQPVLSPPFWKPSLSGRWLHLATTYDADVGQITHYLNGELLHQEQIDQTLVVKTTRIGAASIGNWSIPTRSDAEFAVRNLNGSIDEFAIFAAALTADEVRVIFENGKQ